MGENQSSLIIGLTTTTKLVFIASYSHGLQWSDFQDVFLHSICVNRVLEFVLVLMNQHELWLSAC